MPDEKLENLRSEIIAGLRKAKNRWHVETVDSTASTNSDLSSRFSSSAVAPHLILWTEEQTGGRGRYSRKWMSSKGLDITASLIFSVDAQKFEIPKFTLVAGLALSSAIKTLGLSPEIRWPNDILIDGAKVAGILCAYLAQPNAVICGTGINVNSEPEQYDFGAYKAYSTLKAISGHDIDRVSLYTNFVLQFESLWNLALNENFDELKRGFDSVSFYKGKNLKIYKGAQAFEIIPEDSETLTGIGETLDESGALIVKLDNSKFYHVEIDDVIIPVH